MTNIAKKVIIPEKKGIFRTIFLYTGQGESTLLVVPDGVNYKYILVDSDKDNEPNEIDLVKMFEDLFDKDQQLDVFINTHPHNDHFGGIRELYDKIGISEVWHSNHKPGGKHKEKYKDFKYVLDQVGKSNTYHLKGTNDLNKVRKSDDETEINKKIGDIDFQVLSPSEYLCDDIEEEKADERNRRIHEQCAVIKFMYGTQAKQILFTGDSDKTAWKDHITDYHKDNLPSYVLSASHHGSRTFFKDSEEDKDVYEKHIEIISPEYLIISAPKQEDSPHKHPHSDAIDLYKKYIEDDNILHLGKNYECIIVDITSDGRIEIRPDKDLIEEYGLKTDGKEEKNYSNITIGTTKLDSKAMG